MEQEIEKLNAQVRKLIENQNKIVKKIQEMDFLIKGYTLLDEGLRDRIGGLETALLGAGVLTKEGLELHQSFDHEKLGKQDKIQSDANIEQETRQEAEENREQVPRGAVSAQGQAEA